MLAGAAAGAMGWGIRGQYGHETGAMIAGLLVSLVVVLGLRPGARTLPAFRAVALGAVGVGFGGAMTYGQTLGLTHDATLVGNWSALRWGLLGVGIKGALWIGFFGALLGMGLGGVRYRSRELLVLMLALVGVAWLGTWLLNAPFDPANRVLPRLYFSADWYWQPDAADLRPRREVWGGLLLALAALGAYVGRFRSDGLALRLLGWGVLGGAIGFPLGQCLQAFHAWNPHVFAHGAWATIDPYVNWWNAMETTFGAVMGAAVAFGAWLHRERIASLRAPADATIATPLEWLGLTAHAALLLVAEFTDVPVLGRYADVLLVMGVLPIALIVGGRWSAVVVALPITLLPIAGKTVRRLVYEQATLPMAVGWFVYAVVPLALAFGTAAWIARRADEPDGARGGLRMALLVTTWTYVALNFAFFEWPWPWAPWTRRTLHGLVFFACATILTTTAMRSGERRSVAHV